MKYVKWIVIALFCLPFVLLIGGSCFNTCTEEGCNPIDYAKITDVEYRAEVVDKPGGHGKIIITERLTFDIHAAFKSNLFWELWRDLCEDQYDGIEHMESGAIADTVALLLLIDFIHLFSTHNITIFPFPLSSWTACLRTRSEATIQYH